MSTAALVVLVILSLSVLAFVTTLCVSMTSGHVAEQSKDAPRIIPSPDMMKNEAQLAKERQDSLINSARAKGMSDMRNALLYALIQEDIKSKPRVTKEEAARKEKARIKRLQDIQLEAAEYERMGSAGGNPHYKQMIEKLRAEYFNISSTSATTEPVSKHEKYRKNTDSFTDTAAAEVLIDYEREHEAVFEFDVKTGQSDRKMFEAENNVFDAYIAGGMTWLDRVNDKKADLIAIERRVLGRQHGLNQENRLWIASNNALTLIRNPELESKLAHKEFEETLNGTLATVKAKR